MDEDIGQFMDDLDQSGTCNEELSVFVEPFVQTAVFSQDVAEDWSIVIQLRLFTSPETHIHMLLMSR